MKTTIYTLLLPLLLLSACSVKKETARVRQHTASELEAAATLSAISVERQKENSLANIHIYEQIIETDTLGRPIKEIRRKYNIEQRDSAQKETYSEKQEIRLETSTSETERKEEVRSVKKPTVGRLLVWGVVIGGIAFAGYRLWRLLRA